MMKDLINRVDGTFYGAWSILIICCVVGILFGLDMKHQKEKREALNVTILLLVVYIIVSAFSETVWQIVTSNAMAPKTTPIDLLGFMVIVYTIIYIYLSNAKGSGKAAYHMKLYSSLEGLEKWLNEIGKEGYVCTESSPEWYLFKLKQEENVQYYYKAEYVSTKAKDTAAYIAENVKRGWNVALNSNASQYNVYKATILVFYTTDAALDAGPATRHQPSNLESRLSTTIILNLMIIAILIAINIFVLPNVPAMQFLSILMFSLVALQIAIRIKFSLNKRADFSFKS